MHGVCIGCIHATVKYIFAQFLTASTATCASTTCGTTALFHNRSISTLLRISVFSCYTFELLCGSSSGRCTLIVYTDGGSAKETGKLHNISLHVLYTSLVNFYVNYSLCTLRCFVHNYEGRRKQFFSGQANWLQSCVYREFQYGDEWSYL